MSKRDPELFLQDILECISKLERYTKGYTLKKLETMKERQTQLFAILK